MDAFPSQFWMVFGIGKGAPTKGHASREIAESEARRLARMSPGTTFVVLEAVEAVTKREFDTVTYRAAPPRAASAVDSDIPF